MAKLPKTILTASLGISITAPGVLQLIRTRTEAPVTGCWGLMKEARLARSNSQVYMGKELAYSKTMVGYFTHRHVEGFDPCATGGTGSILLIELTGAAGRTVSLISLARRSFRANLMATIIAITTPRLQLLCSCIRRELD